MLLESKQNKILAQINPARGYNIMIGYNSIVRSFLIKVEGYKKPAEVLVQANKNYGICDIIIPHNLVKPVPPARPTKESNKAYKAAKSEYDSKMWKITQLRSELLTEVQGRQINDECVCIHLYNILYEALNEKECIRG